MIRKNYISTSMEDILQMAPRGITVQFGSWAWQLSQLPADQLSPDITAQFGSWTWQLSHSDQLISCHLTSQLNLAVGHGSSHSDQLIICHQTSQLNLAVGHGSSHSDQLISCHSTPLKTKHFEAGKAGSHLQNTFTHRFINYGTGTSRYTSRYQNHFFVLLYKDSNKAKIEYK